MTVVGCLIIDRRAEGNGDPQLSERSKLNGNSSSVTDVADKNLNLRCGNANQQDRL